MAFDNGLVLGADVPMPSNKNLKVKIVGCMIFAVAAAVMLVTINNSNPVASEMTSGASEMDALAVAASPFTMPRLGALRGNMFGDSASAWTVTRPQVRMDALPGRAVQDQLKMYGIASSPLTELAITAIEATNRRNGPRDVSMNGRTVSSKGRSGWDLVDGKTKQKLVKVLDEVKEKESMLAGVSAPMDFFDPVGFATTVTAGKLLFYREVELKHGRVAMLAALGILVGESFHPLFGGDIDVPAAFAFQQTPLETFWPAVVAAIAIPEVLSVYTFQDPSVKGNELWAIREDQVPGDLGFDPLGLKPQDPKELREMQTKELNNGRLAMIATAGMIAQELATGQKIF